MVIDKAFFSNFNYPRDGMILIYLIVNADDDGDVKTNYKRISIGTGYSVKEVRTSIDRLEWFGKVKGRQRAGNMLVITICNIDSYNGKKQSKNRERADKGQTKYDLATRQKMFYDSLIPFVGIYGKDMVRAFYNKWSEPTLSGTKMKYELEKTWETKRRLVTWKNNEYKYAHKHSTVLNSSDMDYNKNSDWE
ncbi:hypothetical protein HMPREF1860_00857 [Prevotella amnii]|uniref:Uncharacterized protein n=1 Tax=Prevotella amnii TaxID=419005 RepID=A0A134BFK8_9BACT|nr:hypothetical protein [Prevotella amnii]KXB78731.1 hypothetical protein HMPREF1860_00857 [Prevotella amnii]